MLTLLIFSCSHESKEQLQEGEEFDSPSYILDSADESSDSSSPSPSDSADTGEIEESSHEVCYLGPNRENNVCFSTVEWTSAWGNEYHYPPPYQGSTQYSPPLRFLDLQSIDESSQLAPNFVLGEFMQLYKGRYALFMPHVVEKLQNLRDTIGAPLFVNSGYRNVTYNADVGGAEHSRHIYGDAIDMYSNSASLEELQSHCETQGASFTSLYETHIHCDWRSHPLTPAFYDSTTERQPTPDSVIDASIQHTPEGWTAPASGFDEGEPLRRWQSFDHAGNLLETSYGPLFQASANSKRITVLIGGQIERETIIP